VIAARLPGDRLHLQHGPIDLVIGADGARERAFIAVRARFSTVLDELVAELPLLRRDHGPQPRGGIARAMWQAVQPFECFVTPMAAVAGAVADAVLAAMVPICGLQRAYVNNGGDIALHLTQGESFRLARAGLDRRDLGRIAISADDPVRGIATSGRGGRSLTMGIADQVTVLAPSAAMADAAATLIANAVDLPGHPAIRRASADTLRDDSDLGTRPVVTHVGSLTPAEIRTALTRGAAFAESLRASGLITAAALVLANTQQIVGHIDTIPRKEPAHA
jgi:hypothetical protein